MGDSLPVPESQPIRPLIYVHHIGIETFLHGKEPAIVWVNANSFVFTRLNGADSNGNPWIGLIYPVVGVNNPLGMNDWNYELHCRIPRAEIHCTTLIDAYLANLSVHFDANYPNDLDLSGAYWMNGVTNPDKRSVELLDQDTPVPIGRQYKLITDVSGAVARSERVYLDQFRSALERDGRVDEFDELINHLKL